MDINQFDLNLLKVFNELMNQRRVSAVAETLGVTQPAVSNALKRLRGMLKDELFLRGSRGMEPTARAEQLAEPIAYALDTVNSALSQQVVFDPAREQRNFVLGLTDIGEIYFVPPLLAAIDERAPSITLTTERSVRRDLKEDMESGRLDLAMGLLPELEGSFYRRRLFRQRFVLVFRDAHPLAGKKRITVRDFCAYGHVRVRAPGTAHSEVDRLFERQGIERDLRLTVPHFTAVGHILWASDLVATLPERLATRIVKPFELVYVDHPAKLPEHSIDMYWHAKVHRDPAVTWLRNLIFEIFAE